jgi:MarR family transcriptional regulator for hemolysin
VLGFLADGAAASSALAERMAVTAPSVTSVVDGLVARGLVERRPDPLDRRRLPLTLTEAGSQVLQQANVAVGERLGQVLGHVPEADTRASLKSGLNAWQTGLENFRAARDEAKAAARQ